MLHPARFSLFFCCALAASATLFMPLNLSAETSERPQINLANGERNSIDIGGVTRQGNTLTIKQAIIEGNGWLVLHPFEGGKPNGDKYVAYTYLEDGLNEEVDIEVYKGIETGDQFIIMLHKDSNENKILDFVFVSNTGVMDEAVFEGSTMVAHILTAP